MIRAKRRHLLADRGVDDLINGYAFPLGQLAKLAVERDRNPETAGTHVRIPIRRRNANGVMTRTPNEPC